MKANNFSKRKKYWIFIVFLQTIFLFFIQGYKSIQNSKTEIMNNESNKEKLRKYTRNYR